MVNTNDVYDELDELLQEADILFQGLPIGLGEFDITTRDPFLLKVLTRFSDNKSEDVEQDISMSFVDENDGCTWTYVHCFTTTRSWRGKQWNVLIFRNMQTSKVRCMKFPEDHTADRFKFMIETGATRRGSALASAEETARARLMRELTEVQQAQYILNDAVFERGRSGHLYIIRKNRPTIVLQQNSHNGGFHALCALCLHPWAFYTGTWAGAMPPSDEMLAHLLYVRASERLFWRKANQIPLRQPNSGI